MSTPVRLVLADDHPMFRYGLRAVLSGVPEVELVGEAEDGHQLLALVDRVVPDVVLTDLTMPGIDGVVATRRILQRHPAIGVLVLTMHEDEHALLTAMQAGARGYLLKDADLDEIVRGIRAVAAGEVLYGPAVGRRVVDFFTGAYRDRAASVFPELTAREREVLDLVAVGRSNHEIALTLVLSEKTVRNHVATILAKLETRDRASLVARARDVGLGSPP